jgi:hypothetical protein
MVNFRKEFFDVSIDEIETACISLGHKIELVRVPEARDFRESQAIRDQYKKAA